MKFKSWMKVSNVLFLISTILLVSCSTGVRKRGHKQRRAPLRQNLDNVSYIKKKVALLRFFNESPYGGDDLGVTATEEIRRELSRTGEYIIDYTSEQIFGDSKEIYAGGGVKLVQLARKAKLAGINFVLYGRVINARVRERTDEVGFVRQTKSYTESKVEIRIFDVQSNKEVFSEVIDGHANDATYRFYVSNREDHLTYRQELLRYSVRVAVRRIIPKIFDISSKLNWTGRVAKIIGSKIYINAGRDSGLHIGDILKVMTEGSEIYDPETGALLGVSKGEVKGTLEIIDYYGPDGAIAILHSGGSVVDGDFVQLY